MSAQHLTIARTARYHTLGTASGDTREVWFVLHGYGQLARYFLRHFEAIDNGKRLIVAPEALSRFYLSGGQGRVGASWMTREDRRIEIHDTLAYLDALYAHVLAPLRREAVTVHVLGFSQGATAACRWATLGQSPIDRLTLWAGDVPHDLDLDEHRHTLAHLGLSVVVGTQDEYLSDERIAQEEARLRQHHIPYHLLRFDGPHTLDPATLKRLLHPTA